MPAISPSFMTYTSSWRSPSNIALIKYWGKHGLQLPHNPSLSFTLSTCHTNMTLMADLETATSGIDILYDGQPKPSFEPKIKKFFSVLDDFFPWLKNASVKIDSHNTFPHGAGIASSASAMSAIALCLMDINDQINGASGFAGEMWWKQASEIARLGSGSASRSLFPGAAIWGAADTIDQSSDRYAIPWNEQLAPVYKDYQDTILIVSTSEKSVSSTAGHELMKDHDYAATRYAVARKNILRLCDIMKRDDSIEAFIHIVESEALQLHALMMCGDSPFMLVEPGTVAIIKEVWRYRNATGIPVCFTLDAGPNVHLLYPTQYASDVLTWIKKDLSLHCADGQYILDHVGSGPQKIEW